MDERKIFATAFGMALKQARELKGIKSNTLARTARLDGGSVRGWEKGENIPSLQSFVALCTALEIKPADFLMNIAAHKHVLTEQTIPGPVKEPGIE